MEKIQRQMEIETSIRLTKLMCLLNYNSPKGQLDYLVKSYKKSKWKGRTFDYKEVDLIIEAMKSLPGYSPERFIETGEVFKATQLNDMESFDFFLKTAYIYLSMVNPELFEEASDENHEV